MSPRIVCGVLLFRLVPAPAIAQAQDVQPHITVNIGFGNHYGWLGTVGEGYLFGARVSAFAGLGVAPRQLFDFPTTMAGALGLRYYAPLAASRHRAFVDLSVSLLQVSKADMIGAPVVHDYGPGGSLGYSYLARSGFTFTVGAGAGRANHETVPIVHIGLGWTWPR